MLKSTSFNSCNAASCSFPPRSSENAARIWTRMSISIISSVVQKGLIYPSGIQSDGMLSRRPRAMISISSMAIVSS